MSTATEIEFLVNDIELDPESPGGDVLLYTLVYRDPQTGVWDNACEPDLDGVQAAIPMHGVWDDLGARHESDTLFTFGCVSGVLAKCVRWGYRPWTVNRRDLIPYHQACTRNIDGVTLLLECPEKVAIPSLQDLLAGCLVKLTTAGRSAIRTNNDSYVGISLP